MNTVIRLTYILLCVILISPTNLQAADFSHGSNIVRFQYKLALKGNSHAQYKLAHMLETGKGAEVDLEQAKHWYELASKTGSKAAEQRRTYLKVKEEGFDPVADAAWLGGVKMDASNRKADAVLLLGQLYREGLGVKKDLKTSLKLFNRVSIRGVADVDEDIASIQQELNAESKKLQSEEPQNKEPQSEKKQVQQVTLEKKQPVKKNKVTLQAKVQKKYKQQVRKIKATPVKPAAPVALSQEEKIRRYEKARLQLRREQALIDELQSQVTGDEIIALDDEI